jgi:glyoxylase-like metal-dependent hydrolase (beta-lactamase superfamily II)
MQLRIEPIDLRFQGTPHVIASFLIHAPEGPVLVESGPGSTLPTLLAALRERDIRPADVRDVLVTHIHLDHAGAAGWWAQQGARVWVHRVGAPHVVDPSKLLSSATRIYGDRMDELWGDVLPAPADRVHPVDDGDVLDICGLRIGAVDTPGHAGHHHVYQLDDIVFVGDAAGIMLPENRWIDLPAPPPEFDLPRWKTTLGRLRDLGARTLYRTHFSSSSNPGAELQQFEEILDLAVEWVHEMDGRGLAREAMIEEFTARMRSAAAEAGTSSADIRAYELANPRSMSVDGIARFLRKRRS